MCTGRYFLIWSLACANNLHMHWISLMIQAESFPQESCTAFKQVQRDVRASSKSLSEQQQWKSRAGRCWVTLDGTASHSTCWSVGFEGFSCPTALSTQLWQCVTGLGIFWVVRNSRWLSPYLTQVEKIQKIHLQQSTLLSPSGQVKTLNPC